MPKTSHILEVQDGDLFFFGAESLYFLLETKIGSRIFKTFSKHFVQSKRFKVPPAFKTKENYSIPRGQTQKYWTCRNSPEGTVYRSKWREDSYVTLVWHIDGAPIIKVRHLQMWLITGFLVEVNNFSMKNVIVCGLWYSEKKNRF